MATRFIVRAGRHDRRQAPVVVPITNPPSGNLIVRDVASGQSLPAQATAEGITFLLPELAAGSTATFEVANGAASGGVQIEDERGELAIAIDGAPFTRYRYASEGLARPYFWPVHGPGGKQMTRAYPMIPDVPGEAHDHPHHKSIWVAYGEIDGYDAWAEGLGHGSTLHSSFDQITSGPVYGGFVEQLQWVDSRGWGLLTEQRTVRVYPLPDEHRLLDVDMTWTFERKDGRGRRFSLGHVHIGDTKEAGLIGVRVASSMDAKEAGTIENAWGGLSEAETWGRRAPWCDYSGPVDGQTVGIAAFDHPANLHFPCYWHVRNYGLMGSNPFGGENFTGNPRENGSTTFHAGDQLRFRYRLYIHRGGASEGRVGAHWFDFAFPPQVEVQG